MQLRTGIIVDLLTFSSLDHTYNVSSNNAKGNSLVLMRYNSLQILMSNFLHGLRCTECCNMVTVENS